MPDSRFQSPDSRFLQPDSRSQIPEPGFRRSIIGHLASGIWHLASGIWHLASGIWNLESGIPNSAEPGGRAVPIVPKMTLVPVVVSGWPPILRGSSGRRNRVRPGLAKGRPQEEGAWRRESPCGGCTKDWRWDWFWA